MIILLTWISWHWTENLTIAYFPGDSLFSAELEIHKYSFYKGILVLSRNLGRMENNRLKNVILLCKGYPAAWFGVKTKSLSFIVLEEIPSGNPR